jgi:glutamyl-tRNA synthetase
LKKATAINGEHIRMLDFEDYKKRALEYLQKYDFISKEISPSLESKLNVILPETKERVNLLEELPTMLKFIFDSEDANAFENPLDEGSLKQLKGEYKTALNDAINVLNTIDDSLWTASEIKSLLEKEFLETEKYKPRDLFSPLRAVVTKQKISPPLFESMEALGKELTIKNIEFGIEYNG